MAPITDDTVQALRDTIHKLESRVQQLESRLGGGDDGSSKAGGSRDAIRMILMGPPGAGIRPTINFSLNPNTDRKGGRQGNTSAQDSREILCLSSGKGAISTCLSLAWHCTV